MLNPGHGFIKINVSSIIREEMSGEGVYSLVNVQGSIRFLLA